MAVEESLISVIIPVRNGERFLGRTLASAQAQTYDYLEIIVVDDGSTDQTASLVETAAVRDSRIRFFRTQNGGVAAARNFGAGQARGAFIAPLDADDLWHPEKLLRLVKAMQASSSKVGLVYCWSIDIDENDFVIPAVHRVGQGPVFHGPITSDLAAGCFIDTSSAPLIKRSCFEAIGGYDVNLQPQGAEDWKLYLALSEICDFEVVPEYLVGYRQTSGSLSRTRGMAGSNDFVIDWLTKKWPDLPGNIECQRTLDLNIYLARMAVSDNQLVEALRYIIRATKGHPAVILKRSTWTVIARFLFRMTGLRKAGLFKYWLNFRPRVSFQEFSATKK